MFLLLFFHRIICFVKFLLIENNTIFIYTSFQKSIPPLHICNILLHFSKIQIGFFFLWLIEFYWLVSDVTGLQLGSVVKFQFFALFSVDLFPHLIMSSLVLFLY